MIPSDPRKAVTHQTDQFLLYLREYWILANQTVEEIDGVNGKQLTGQMLVDRLNAAVAVRANLAASINADVRARLLIEYPNDFTDAADRDAQIAAANSASNSMLTEMSNLIAVVKASGQLVDANDTSGRIDSVITSPESDALRAACVSLMATIADPGL